MNQLTEQVVFHGLYTLHCYQVDEDTGNSKQTLIWAQHHAAAENKRDYSSGWAIFVGEGEVNALFEQSANLAKRMGTLRPGQKSLSVRDHCMAMRAVVEDGGKLHVDFPDQKPAALSSGTESRWRLFPGSPEALLDLLTCFAALADAPARVVATIPHATSWLVPDGLRAALQGFAIAPPGIS